MALPRSSEVFLLISALILDPCSQCCLCSAFRVSFSPLPRCLIGGYKKWALSQTGKWIISKCHQEAAGESLNKQGLGKRKAQTLNQQDAAATSLDREATSSRSPCPHPHTCLLPRRQRGLGEGRSSALISEFNAWGRVTSRSGEKKEGSYCPRSPKVTPIFIWTHKTIILAICIENSFVNFSLVFMFKFLYLKIFYLDFL